MHGSARNKDDGPWRRADYAIAEFEIEGPADDVKELIFGPVDMSGGTAFRCNDLTIKADRSSGLCAGYEQFGAISLSTLRTSVMGSLVGQYRGCPVFRRRPRWGQTPTRARIQRPEIGMERRVLSAWRMLSFGKAHVACPRMLLIQQSSPNGGVNLPRSASRTQTGTQTAGVIGHGERPAPKPSVARLPPVGGPSAAGAAAAPMKRRRITTECFAGLVADCEVRLIGSMSNLLPTLTAAAAVRPATGGVPSSVLKWRRGRDSNPRYPQGVQRFSRPSRSTAPAPLRRERPYMAIALDAATDLTPPPARLVNRQRAG